jgi:hypothetical protein
MCSTRTLLRVGLLVWCAVAACEGTDTVSISIPRDASTSAAPGGAAPRDAGEARLDAGEAPPGVLDASSDAAADGGDTANETAAAAARVTPVSAADDAGPRTLRCPRPRPESGFYAQPL